MRPIDFLKIPALSKLLLALFAAAAALPAAAGPGTDALSACLSDNTTGKERKELARWVFVAMAAHPEMRDLSAATMVSREQAYQSMGVLVTRLLSENCAGQTRTAIRSEGSESLQTAFSHLGKLAMQELMSHKDVQSSISGFERYIDRRKLDAALAFK